MPKDRKPSIWSRGRIDQLIQLYQKQECLWNPFDEYYKHKGKRNKAIEIICKELNVSKPEYAKKIHNLRNQFNSELKKYEKLLEENEELEEGNASNGYQCRWVHYQSLMFLKDVIAPRPGTQAHQNKKIRLESNNSSSAIISHDIYNEETNLDDDDNDEFDGFESLGDFQNTKEETREIITLNKPEDSIRLHPAVTSLQMKQTAPQQPEMQSTNSQSLVAGTVIELNASNSGGNISNENQTVLNNPFEIHDQWSAFGKFIANEFRNFHSESSRRKLKRRIMQAMLEIGEEDDALTPTKYN